jgi:excisionase family DNA binding protein
MRKDILNLEEAVAFLKTSKPTLYRWMGENKIKGFKVGREWRFYRSDLVEFMESTDSDREVVKKEFRKAIQFYNERLAQKGLKLN